MISDGTKKEIEEYLTKWITDLAKRKESEFQAESDSMGTQSAIIKPFHQAMLSDSTMRSFSIERSFSTSLGSTFEQCAYIIAKERFEPKIQYSLEGYIPANTLSEVDKIVSDLDRKKSSNYQHEANRIADLSKNDTSAATPRSVISDLYVYDSKNDVQMFFEMKTPKPNKGQCLHVTRTHLWIHSILKKGFPKVQTYYAMGYNPYGDGKEYSYTIAKSYLDIKRHLLIGSAFWDHIGGKGAYGDLLGIYRKVGHSTGIPMFNKILHM